MTNLFYLLILLSALWTAWLLIDGLLKGEVWVKGGSKDRFTRQLDMHSFAHKVSREEKPVVYWFNIGLYSVFIVFLLYMLLKQ